MQTKYKVWTDLLLHVGPAQMHPEHTVIMTKQLQCGRVTEKV